MSVVGERRIRGEVAAEAAVDFIRVNAGMSSENYVRIIMAENLRFPEEGSSTQGKSGPKPRANAVGDGQQVEIPVPPKVV